MYTDHCCKLATCSESHLCLIIHVNVYEGQSELLMRQHNMEVTGITKTRLLNRLDTLVAGIKYATIFVEAVSLIMEHALSHKGTMGSLETIQFLEERACIINK